MIHALAVLGFLSVSAPNPKWVVEVDKPTVKVSKDLYGIFFEEINCAGDGGLYAELVRNRGFEESDKPDHWTPFANASATVDGEPGKRVLNLKGPKGCWISNNGYWGINIEAGKDYHFSLRVAASYESTIMVRLRGATGKVLSEGTVSCEHVGKKDLVLRANASDPAASLELILAEGPHMAIDDVSLFPEETYLTRPNGMRPDLATMLAELKPGFMRFPGGCWVEGDTMATAYRWKTTIGDVGARRTVQNLWRYKSGNGLGYHEYLQLCEDLGAAPMFVINCGMSHKEVVPLDQMGEYVQDALDAIEYANGPADSKWGAVRAATGHPKPFNLKYLEIGNENGGPAYEERYGLIFRAVKAKYPEIQTIACVWGGTPKNTPLEIIDEHYYSNPDFFIQNADRYDTYDRKGPKIYVGEYAVTQGVGSGNLRGAVAEAAFMTGMERNSDIVVMSSYAPLFANVNLKVWNPDLIYFDSSRVVGTPSYHVQKMFSSNRADEVLRSKLDPGDMSKASFSPGGVGVGTWNTQAEFRNLKVVSGGKVLLESPDGSKLSKQSGSWNVVDGALRQSANSQPASAILGNSGWTNYTFTVEARKISGAEGFLVLVGCKDMDNYVWFNVGGWGNREHGMEVAVKGGKSRIGRQVPGSVPTGQWVKLRVDYSPERVKAFIDGKQVFDEQMPTLRPLHGVAGRMADGSVVLKLVNAGEKAQMVDIDLGKGSYEGLGNLLTSTSPTDENTLDKPDLVSPRPFSVKRFSRNVTVNAPGNSVTVVRLKPVK